MAASLKELFQNFTVKIGEKIRELQQQIGEAGGGGSLSPDEGNDLTLDESGAFYFKQRTPEEIAAAYEGLADVNRFSNAYKQTVDNFTTNLSNKADLDPATGKLRIDQVPKYSITDVINAAETTLAGFIANVNNYTFDIGDVVVIDNAGSLTHYFYNGEDRTLETSYSEVNPASLSTVEWGSVSGKPLPISELSGINTGDQDLSGLALDSEVVKSVSTNQGTPVTPDENGNVDITVESGGVESVTGTAVDNTDPQNPVINIPESGVSDVQDSNGNSLVVEGVAVIPEQTGGGGTAVERTIKTISNTSQHTLIAADFTDFILDFTANGGQTINVILNAGVAPLNGQIQAISSGNNTLTPTVGSGTGSSTYDITIDSPTEGQEFTEGDTITVTGTVTETPSAGTVEFIFPENTNPTTTGLNAWIGGVVLSADKVSWNGNFESTETGYDDTALAARVTDLEGAEPLKEHEIEGDIIITDVSGTYEIDYNDASLWILTLTAATTFTESNIPTGSKVIELKINGNFALTLPARWAAKPSNDSYLGTVRNSILVSSHGISEALYTLENLA